MDNFKKNRYISNFLRDARLITAIALIITACGALFVLTSYKPSYVSNAKIWIRDNSQDNFITDVNENSQMKPLTEAGNPVLTQIELLQSRQLNNLLIAYIAEKYPNMIKRIKNKDKFTSKIISTDYKIGSDVIDISLSHGNPSVARDLLENYLIQYKKLNTLISTQLKTDKREYIDAKVDEVQNKLVNVRERIKTFKSHNLAVDINEEANMLVDQKINALNKMEDLSASINSTRSLAKSLERELSMNSKDALNAVALGAGNDTLEKLRDSLNQAIQEYTYDRVKYAEESPKIIALKNKISVIKEQIEKQMIMTIGKSANKNGLNIFDPTRQKLVDDLVTAKTQAMALRAQKRSIQGYIGRINAMQSRLPSKEYTLTTLLQEERTLSSAYDDLKKKQLEARIKEAEPSNNSIVIDEPSLPAKASFPGPVHIMFFSLMLGLSLGMTFSGIKTYFDDTCTDVNAIKRITKGRIIGIIPWLKEAFMGKTGESIQNISYKNIAANIMTKCYKSNNKVLTFTSTAIKKNNSTNLYNLARELHQLGQSVIIVDANISMPTIHREANISDKVKINLSETISEAQNNIEKFHDLPVGTILRSITKDNTGLSYLLNTQPVENPYNYFVSPAFNVIIETLKSDYDWILIDTPAPTVSPEFIPIAQLSDGLILFTNINVTKSELKRVVALLNDFDIPLIGSIVREQGSNLEKDYIEYVKHLNNSEYSTISG